MVETTVEVETRKTVLSTEETAVAVEFLWSSFVRHAVWRSDGKRPSENG